MRFAFLILSAFIALLVLYYITVVIHIAHPIFTHVTIQKSLIPFYGWRKWWKQLGVIALVLTLLTSCQQEGDHVVDNSNYRCVYVADQGNRFIMNMFEMDGHKWYISGHSIFHHPDCECTKSRVDTLYVIREKEVKTSTSDDWFNF